MNSDIALLIPILVLLLALGVAVLLVWKRLSSMGTRSDIRDVRSRLDDALGRLSEGRSHGALEDALSDITQRLVAIERLEPTLHRMGERTEELAQELARHDAEAKQLRENLDRRVLSVQIPADGAGIEERLDALERVCVEGALAESEYEIAFLRSCRESLDGLRQVMAYLSFDPGWTPDAAQVKALVALAQGVPGDVKTFQVSPERRDALRKLADEIDDVRCRLLDDLGRRFDLQPIAPVPGQTRFDPTLHEDAPATRLTPTDPAQAQLIYAQISIGFQQRGQVLERAWVKRYANLDSPPPMVEEEPRPAYQPFGEEKEAREEKVEMSEARTKLEEAADLGRQG